MSGGYFLGPPARRRRRPRGRRGALFVVALVLAAAAAVAVVAATRSGVERRGADVSTLVVDSKLVDRRLEQKVAVPAGGAAGRPLLALLHGPGAEPGGAFSDEFFAELERLGKRAPVVVEVGGGESSYYHDRRDGRWGTYVVREVIPAVVRRFDVDARRIAIGGAAMGGFGALDIARREPGRFCAVGGHSAAVWRRARDAPGERSTTRATSPGMTCTAPCARTRASMCANVCGSTSGPRIRSGRSTPSWSGCSGDAAGR